MASSVESRLPPGIDRATAQTAFAAIPEAHASYSAYPKIGIVAGEPDRLDARSVEHTRQSRLQRWQRLP